jgi:hypothetical protein
VVAAESLLLKDQLLISHRSSRRWPHLESNVLRLTGKIDARKYGEPTRFGESLMSTQRLRYRIPACDVGKTAIRLIWTRH